jgi:hypothetical protein
MPQQILGDFHINPQLPPSHIPQSQYQQENVQEVIQPFGPPQIVLFEPLGEISTTEQPVMAIK